MPIIAISRAIFSGGLPIAEKLAERLGYPCAGRDELHESMEQFGLSDELLQSIFLGLQDGVISPSRRVAILNLHRAALLRYVKAGNLVYHGSVGHLLLSSIPNILRVRINASMDKRVHLAMKSRRINHDQAIGIIRKDDQECEAGARCLYDVDWRDPSLYDLVLNVNNISVDNAVEVLFRMEQFETFHASPTSRREYNDLFLSCVVWAELVNHPQLAGADIMVTASEGRVTVHGQVRSKEMVEAIPGVVEKVEGVLSVNCNVVVGSFLWAD